MSKKSLHNQEKIFNFLHEVESLKSTLRFNQTRAGRNESTADHSWRLALLSFIACDELNLNLDMNKVMKLALVHDLPEAITGDIDAIEIANGNITKEEKQKNEVAAMKQIRAKLPKQMGKDIFDLWREYEDHETEEAKFIKALDKIETVTQLVEMGYETWDYPEFIGTYPDKAVKDFPPLLDMLKILKQRLKKEFERGGIEWKEEFDAVFQDRERTNESIVPTQTPTLIPATQQACQ